MKAFARSSLACRRRADNVSLKQTEKTRMAASRNYSGVSYSWRHLYHLIIEHSCSNIAAGTRYSRHVSLRLGAKRRRHGPSARRQSGDTITS